MTTAEMLLRLGAGVGLGALIGLERQYRARMAGLKSMLCLVANPVRALARSLFDLRTAIFQRRRNG